MEEPTSGDERTIICNGKQMQILENLFHGIRQLQKSEMMKGPIWIDAICINQSDEAEKSAQVKMMNKIFEAATRVIVWLGRASLATEFILGVADPCFTGEVHDFIGEDDEEALNTGMVALSLKATSRILRRGWFCRVWTLQEAILARELVYLLGPHQLPFDHLLKHVGEVTRFDERSKYVDATLSHFRSRMMGIEFVNQTRTNRSESVSCTLEEAITEARNRKAGDLRDKVFAVMSLCTTVESNETARLTIDYQKSVQEVFCDCAVALLESKNTGIFLLSLVGQFRHGSPVHKVFSSSRIESWMPDAGFTPDLPSWVPDLGSPARPLPLRKISRIQYSAATNLTPCYEVSGGEVLSIRAAVLGKITAVGDTLSYRLLHRPLWKFLCVPCHLDTTTYWPTGEPVLSAFWRTLVAGSTHASDGVELNDSHFCDWFVSMAEECLLILDDEMRDGILQQEEEGKGKEKEEREEKRPTNLPYIAKLLDDIQGDSFSELLQVAGEFLLDPEENLRRMTSDFRQLIAEEAKMHKKISAVRQFIDRFDTPEYGLYAGIKDGRKGTQDSTSSLGATESGGMVTGKEKDVFDFTFKILNADREEKDVFGSIFKILYADRRIFVTENGYMGTAPWTVQEGDVVMFVAGAYVPYVFRPAGEGAWQLIGEAYCHGAMFGEDLAMEGLNFEMIRVI